MRQEVELLTENSRAGRRCITAPGIKNKPGELPAGLKRAAPAELPQVSELDLVRHFTNLSRLNFSVDTHFYPLGSCTMKYNVKATEVAASMPGFTGLHPLTPVITGGEKDSQGALEALYRLEYYLGEITGMDAVTAQPLAGAHGEMTGILMIAAYHHKKGNNKKTVIVPDSSHGTNPASAAMAGYEIVTIATRPDGELDMDAFRAALNSETAAVMMTCPNTLGIFETHIREICDAAHSVDALMYYDGANLNAIMGKVRPGDVGFDVIHLNVHKTFGTPHGGGGPGGGPVGVKKNLVPFLPGPRVEIKNSQYHLTSAGPDSIGQVSNYYGNYGVLLKALAYIELLGKDGLIETSEMAVLHANYIQASLKNDYKLPYDRLCMHETVFSAEKQNANGIHALDIAKGLIDRGFHPPTVYFPLMVKEAIMVEPTETESKETLDAFIDAMKEIAREAEQNPAALLQAPLTTPVTRLDETKAARDMKVCLC